MEGTAIKTGLTDQELDAMAERVLSEGQFDLPADGEGAEEILTDEYGLPFEPEGCYNSAPLAFEEMVQELWIVTNNAHYAATRYNRHSPTYMLLSDYLEKNIRQLGSCCITKAVIEHEEGEKFGFLSDLTIKRLRKIIGFNFRKCYQSFMESQTLGHYNAATLNLSVRWAALDKRLIATAEKIEKINAGKVKVDLSEYERKEPDNSETKASDKAEQNTRCCPFAYSFHPSARRKSTKRCRDYGQQLLAGLRQPYAYFLYAEIRQPAPPPRL